MTYQPTLSTYPIRYCIHRTRAQGLNVLFQQHSLYQFQGLRRGHVIRDAVLGTFHPLTTPCFTHP